jgi:hypothetical protein
MEREPSMEIVVGKKGVGKSYLTKQQIDSYVMNDPSTGRSGRPVLVIDTTGEYSDYKTVYFDIEEKNELIRARNIIKIKAPIKYRILCFKKNGQPMNVNEIVTTVSTAAKFFRNGLLVLEDINKYILHSVRVDIVGLLVSIRHLGVDLILHYQAARKIPPTMWQNCNFLRMHKQIETVDVFRNRVPDFEIIKLSEFVVNRRYESGDYHYCCWVAIEDSYVVNVSEEDWKQACKDYFFTYPKDVRRYLAVAKNNREQALQKFIEEKIKYVRN